MTPSWEKPAEFGGALGEAGTFKAAQKPILSYSKGTLNLDLATWPEPSRIRGQL